MAGTSVARTMLAHSRRMLRDSVRVMRLVAHGQRPYMRSPASTWAAGGIGLGLMAATLHCFYDEADDLQYVEVQADHKLTRRELRFLQFASIEYDDVIYMSPMDFVDSLTLDQPRERVYRRVLSGRDVQTMLQNTPPLRKNSKNLFRKLDQNGLISYADYLFLLTVLTKSRSAFRIAFSMFDDDENGKVDKDEFLVIRSLISSMRSTRRAREENEACHLDPSDYHFVVTHARDRRLYEGTDTQTLHFKKTEQELRRQETTLLLHLFGIRGRESLTFNQFQHFYNNLQSELMEMEFAEFSRGKEWISPVDFARLMLRYASVDRHHYSAYINRVQRRCTASEQNGVSLADFKTFSLFINNLEEFQTAVRLYTNADVKVSKVEFQHAVRAMMGRPLAESVLHLIFAVFDANGDGRLSYGEFLGVMNDRFHHGLKPTSSSNSVSWAPFKQCITRQLNNPV